MKITAFAFTDADFDTLVARDRAELLPALGHVREMEQYAYRDDEPADEHMEHMFDSLKMLGDKFGDDADAVRMIEREIDLARDWIINTDRERPEKISRSLGTAGSIGKPHGSRSIFDDVDA
jgi:hypothetical protein